MAYALLPGGDLSAELAQEWGGIERMWELIPQTPRVLTLPPWARWARIRCVALADGGMLVQRGVQQPPADYSSLSFNAGPWTLVAKEYGTVDLYLGCKVPQMTFVAPSDDVAVLFSIELLEWEPKELRP